MAFGTVFALKPPDVKTKMGKKSDAYIVYCNETKNFMLMS